VVDLFRQPLLLLVMLVTDALRGRLIQTAVAAATAAAAAAATAATAAACHVGDGCIAWSTYSGSGFCCCCCCCSCW